MRNDSQGEADRLARRGCPCHQPPLRDNPHFLWKAREFTYQGTVAELVAELRANGFQRFWLDRFGDRSFPYSFRSPEPQPLHIKFRLSGSVIEGTFHYDNRNPHLWRRIYGWLCLPTGLIGHAIKDYLPARYPALFGPWKEPASGRCQRCTGGGA